MLKGFYSEVFDSQSIFRKLLTSMAEPGTIQESTIKLTPPKDIHLASGAILLTLMDYETPFWSDIENTSESIEWITFHTGAPYIKNKDESLFAFCSDCEKLPCSEEFNQGTIESPHISTTVIIQTKELKETGSIKLTGPGIEEQKRLEIDGISNEFIQKREILNEKYPLGVDMIFVSGNKFLSIPRTSMMEIV